MAVPLLTRFLVGYKQTGARGLCKDPGRALPQALGEARATPPSAPATHCPLVTFQVVSPLTVPRCLARAPGSPPLHPHGLEWARATSDPIPKQAQDRPGLRCSLLEEGAAREPTGSGEPGLATAAGGRVSPVYVPAEEVVLHQHVLNALLQRLLLLLHTGTASACAARGAGAHSEEARGDGGQRGSGTTGCRHSGSPQALPRPPT